MPESAEIQSLFIELPNLYSTYSTQVPNKLRYENESKTIDNKIQGLNLQLQDLDRKDETYDREFLDRTRNPRPKGFFYRMGLRTTEDCVFAYFFFSYCVFFFLLLIIVLIYSDKKIRGFIIVIGAALIFGFVSLFLLYRYA